MNQSLENLESRIHDLIGKISQLRTDNAQLTEQLSAARLDYEEQVASLTLKLDDARSQARANESAAAFAATAAQSAKEVDELTGKIQFQEQQIQLLEKERMNLRDQINFLQNTIQNKEKDWQDRFDEQEQQQATDRVRINTLQEQLRAAEDSFANITKELESQKLLASEAQANLDARNQSLRDQLDTLQAQLTDTQLRLTTSNSNAEQLQEELKEVREALLEQERVLMEKAEAEKERANTKMAQEAERFRIEFALQAQKHEQSLSRLNQAISQQKERLQAEKTELQEQIRQLNNQNQEYRSMLLQSANNIRALLARLPAPEHSFEPVLSETVNVETPKAIEETVETNEVVIETEIMGETK